MQVNYSILAKVLRPKHLNLGLTRKNFRVSFEFGYMSEFKIDGKTL
jgi:hypothetical protein